MAVEIRLLGTYAPDDEDDDDDDDAEDEDEDEEGETMGGGKNTEE